MTCKPAYHFIPVAPPETENGVHGNVKSIQHQVSSIGTTPSQHPSTETAGKSSRKVSNLFRHDRRIMRVFDSGERRLPARSRNEGRDEYPRKEKG